MGRPPMGFKKLTVRLPIGMPERIEVVAGKGQGADWIRRILEEALEKQEAKPE